MNRATNVGVSRWRTLTAELPQILFRRGYNALTAIIYSAIDDQGFADTWTRKSLEPLVRNEGPLLYVIVVPRVLHFLVIAVQLVQRHVDIVFLLNGISAVEERALKEQFPEIPTLRIWTIPKSSWPHGQLLSLLLRVSKRDFGILDHDLFLFDPSVFEQLDFHEDEFAITISTWRNRFTGLEFPLTHLLYLRVDALRELMSRHRIGAQLYKRIPANVRRVVAEMGLSLDNPPKEYQSFFDSFLLLSSLAMKEGLAVRKLEIGKDDWEHVGGTSMGLPVTKDAVHHYISCRFLDLFSNKVIHEEYRRHGLAMPEKAERLRKLVDSAVADRVDELIDRIKSAI